MFLTECPRDAMQGWHEFIPTAQKIDYINALMQVNFSVLDCGSFVSPRIIPQMKDTSEVLKNIEKTQTKISVIVANLRGAEQALQHSNVDILGFPFSISETFQFRNTNKRQEQAFEEIQEILSLCKDEKKTLKIYFSMAFGNPYGELWQFDDLVFWANRFDEIGIRNILLSDTTGVASLRQIQDLFHHLPKKFPKIQFGAHFHTAYNDAYPKLKTAFDEGCREFDGAIKGIGGCPMAKKDLVGNMPTEKIINFLATEKIQHSLNLLHYEYAYNQAKNIFKF